jgi:4a-hydroxytetrahydrobiopterin dehydratase
MKTNLSKLKCRACEGLADKLKKKQVNSYKKELKGWKIIKNKLSKTYKFKNFKQALKFVNKVGKIAESEQHHPNIDFTWGFVNITLYTHMLSGLSINDFILASKIDKIKKT